MRNGKKIHEQIDDAIRLYDRLLLVLSEDSMKSSWVKTEISNARQKERASGRKVLFPIRLLNFEVRRSWKLFDGDLAEDSAKEIREYYVPDFSSWKNYDDYKNVFDRLVADLKTETSAG